MPEVDTNIYNKLNAQQDPMDTMSKVVGIARGINQNKLFNQQFDTNIGLGEAYKRSVGPDGQIDENKLTNEIVRDPRTRWNLPEAMRAVQQQKQTKIGMDTAALELANKRVSTLRNGLGTFLDQPNPKKSDIIDFAGKLVAHGILTPQMMATELADMPAEGPALNEWLRKHYIKALDTEKQIGAMYGVPQTVNTGGTTKSYRQKTMPRPGETGVIPQGDFTNTQAPGSTEYDPKTRTQRKVLEGSPGRFIPEGQQQNQQPEAPKVAALDSIPGQRRTPAPMEEKGKPKNQDRVPVGRTGPAGPALGESEGATKVGAESGDQYGTDLRRASNYTREIFPLTKAIPALEKLGTTGTGPKTDQMNEMKSLLASLGVPGIDLKKIQNYDEAKKYLTDFVNQTGNIGTNDKLAASFAGNPNVHMSNAAAVDVAKSALALRRMQHAQVLAFQETGLPESQYTQWASKWQSGYKDPQTGKTIPGQDPRAYGIDYMTSKARKKLNRTLKGKEREAFNASLKLAMELGIVGQPRNVKGQ